MTRNETHRPRTRTTATVVAATALALGLGLAAPAQAATTRKNDARGDVMNGSAGQLDLARVELRTKGKAKIQVTFGFHGAANDANLARPGGVAAEFLRNKDTLRSVQVFTEDGALVARVCSYDLREQIPEATDCSPLPVTRVDDSTLKTVVPRNKLKKDARTLKWHASAFDVSASAYAIDPLGRGPQKPFRWKL